MFKNYFNILWRNLSRNKTSSIINIGGLAVAILLGSWVYDEMSYDIYPENVHQIYIFTAFAVIAIIVAGLGLFGLAASITEQRIKEIGICKVLGASVSSVWLLLSKDFILLVTISCIIASPVAFYFLDNWLQQYDYRITISPFVFVTAGIAAIVITIITVSFQAIKAAIANPVKSLRSE